MYAFIGKPHRAEGPCPHPPPGQGFSAAWRSSLSGMTGQRRAPSAHVSRGSGPGRRGRSPPRSPGKRRALTGTAALVCRRACPAAKAPAPASQPQRTRRTAWPVAMRRSRPPTTAHERRECTPRQGRRLTRSVSRAPGRRFPIAEYALPRSGRLRRGSSLHNCRFCGVRLYCRALSAGAHGFAVGKPLAMQESAVAGAALGEVSPVVGG